MAEYRPPVDERRSSEHRSSAFEQKKLGTRFRKKGPGLLTYEVSKDG